MLKERAVAFRADPEVQAAMEFSGLGSLATPTLAPGESYSDLPGVYDYDADAIASQGYGFVQLQQLALEHLLGAR
jgi:xylose isomerase